MLTGHTMLQSIASKVRKAYRTTVGAVDSILGESDPLLPPGALRDWVGHGDFKAIGEEFRGYFVELGGLKPDHRVLDVGCGVGRMAAPLTSYLKGGSYEGFDVAPAGIDWCRRNITTRYPNFRFQLVDNYNKAYNPGGTHKSSDYNFPYESDSFDFLFLASVFTHMLLPDLENYLSEIVRVLKRNARCLITFHLLNAESWRLIEQKQLPYFQHELEGAYVHDTDTPETGVAYEEIFVRELYQRYGLRIVEPIHYGSWCERDEFLSYQDIVVATKGGG